MAALPDLTSKILYRDSLLLVIDKPAGLPVHAGPGGGPNLEQGFDALRFGFPKPPGLAHRLDRDTSGCLALGRHAKALRKLGKLFQESRIEKTYWAVAVDGPAEDAGVVDAPLFKQTNPRGGWRMIVDPRGQPATTEWRVLGRGGGLAWMAFFPRTGRTHQIRVHAASGLGCPLVGDPQYGGPSDAVLHLHARRLILPLYPSRPPVDVEAPVPPHMCDALRRCGWVGDPPAALAE